MRDLCVVKVGGSLFNHAGLGPGLRTWLDRFSSPNVLLVPGGGPTTDVVRILDQRHRLGEEKAHWLALRALSLNAFLLAELLPGSVVTESIATPVGKIAILDPFPFCREDERNQSRTLSHSWSVTSDSVAARVAICAEARELVLLKSVAIPTAMTWREAGRLGFVDREFANTVGSARNLYVRAINFRELLM